MVKVKYLKFFVLCLAMLFIQCECTPGYGMDTAKIIIKGLLGMV